MFEKIISKNTEEESSAAPELSPPAPPQPAPVSPSGSAQSPRPVAISAGQRNVLLSDVEIVGEVAFENDLVVDGRIEGKISSDGSLTIGESAKIKAEITCGSVVVLGKVQGNITVTDRVEIRAKAEVIGDIKAAALVMEAGAIYVGASTIGTPKSRPASSQGKPSGGSPTGKKDGGKPSGGPAKEAQSAPAKAS